MTQREKIYHKVICCLNDIKLPKDGKHVGAGDFTKIMTDSRIFIADILDFTYDRKWKKANNRYLEWQKYLLSKDAT